MRSERLTIRVPGELASSIRRYAAEAGLPPATMARLFVERAILRGDAAEISRRLEGLESAISNHGDELKKIVSAVLKIVEANK